MRNIFIIHGSYGHPEENWFPWLKKELEKSGNRVFVPRFPIPDKRDPAYGGHKLKSWLKEFDSYRKYINDKTVIVAHSRGCIFCYHLAATLRSPIDSFFLVAPWSVYRWYPKGWNKTDSFHQKKFQWDKIAKSAKYIHIFQSTNDDTPVSEGEDIADRLHAQLTVVPDAGHFNIAYDKNYMKFPLLLKALQKRFAGS